MNAPCRLSAGTVPTGCFCPRSWYILKLAVVSYIKLSIMTILLNSPPFTLTITLQRSPTEPQSVSWVYLHLPSPGKISTVILLNGSTSLILPTDHRGYGDAFVLIFPHRYVPVWIKAIQLVFFFYTRKKLPEIGSNWISRLKAGGEQNGLERLSCTGVLRVDMKW